MSLARRSVESGIYSVSSSFVQTAISFVRATLLLRLLTPEIFGQYHFISAIIVWTGTLPNFGMTVALVHRAPESAGEPGLRNHFSLTLIFNLIWGVLMGALAFWIFPDQSSQLIFLVLLSTQIIDNLTLTGRFKLTRAVQFRRLAVINLLITLVGSIFAVGLAYSGYGVWSLVSTDIVAAGLMFAGVYLLRPVWRVRLGLDRQQVRYFLDYGRRAFLSGPLLQALNKFDDIWAGLYLGEAALGFYSRAYALATYPGTILAAPVNPVATATYAELKEATRKLSLAFERVNLILVRSGFFLGGWLALIATEFVLIIAGESWLPMVNTFRLMLIFTLLNPLKQTIAGLFGALGKPEIGVQVQIVQLAVLGAGLYLLGLPFGLEGVALAVDVMMAVGILLLLVQARKLVQISVRKIFLLPTLILLAAILITWLLIETTDLELALWTSLILKSGLFAALYIGGLILFEHRELREMFQFVRKLLRTTEAGSAGQSEDTLFREDHESNDPDPFV